MTLLFVLLAACADAPAPAPAPPPATPPTALPGKAAPGSATPAGQGLALSSTAFVHDGPIPKAYTCEGDDRSPPLAWSGVPDGAKSLALIVDDPDAPDPANPRMTWVHWVVYNIPASTPSLPEGATTESLAPIAMAANDFKKTDYGGPCPPIGRHRYFHKLYALDTMLEDVADKAALERAIQGHVIARAELVGTYEKH